MLNQSKLYGDIERVKRHDLYINNINKVREQSRQWCIQNRNHKNRLTKENRIKRRKLCIAHYGGKCECCGIDIYEFLSIDHINGGGCKHIKQLGGNGTGLYSWLIHNNYPQGFRILCHNCNHSMGSYGYCPHRPHKPRVDDRKSRIRLRCIMRYGGRCACCNEDTVEFLAIDHPNKDGAVHRLTTGCGTNFYYWLQRNNYPDGFRVLCHNCNFANGLYGRCPHVIRD